MDGAEGPLAQWGEDGSRAYAEARLRDLVVARSRRRRVLERCRAAAILVADLGTGLEDEDDDDEDEDSHMQAADDGAWC